MKMYHTIQNCHSQQREEIKCFYMEPISRIIPLYIASYAIYQHRIVHLQDTCSHETSQHASSIK